MSCSLVLDSLSKGGELMGSPLLCVVMRHEKNSFFKDGSGAIVIVWLFGSRDARLA